MCDDSKQTTNSSTSQSGTTSTTPVVPSWISDPSQGYASQVAKLIGSDPSQYVAPATSLQQQGFTGASNLGSWQQTVQQALGQVGQVTGAQAPTYSAAPQAATYGYNPAQAGATSIGPTANATATTIGSIINGGGLGTYMSPYTDSVVNTSLQGLDKTNGQDQAAYDAAAGLNKSFGGSGFAIGKTNLVNSQALSRAQEEASLRDQAFTRATGLAGQDATTQTGVSEFNAGQQNASAIAQANLDQALKTGNRDAINAAQAQLSAAQNTSSLDAAGRTDTASHNNQSSMLQQLQNLLSGAGITAGIGAQQQSGAASDVATQLTAGNAQRSIDADQRSAPLNLLSALKSLLGYNPSAFIGSSGAYSGQSTSDSTTTSTPSILDTIGKLVGAAGSAAGMATGTGGFQGLFNNLQDPFNLDDPMKLVKELAADGGSTGFLGAAPPYQPSIWDNLSLLGANLRSDPRYAQMAQENIKGKEQQAAQQAQAAIVQKLLGTLTSNGPPQNVQTPSTGDASLDGSLSDLGMGQGTPVQMAAPTAQGITPERQKALTIFGLLNPTAANSMRETLQGSHDIKQGTDGSFYDGKDPSTLTRGPTANRTAVNGTIIDTNDPLNTNRAVPEAPVKGALPVYDNLGHVTDWRLPPGAAGAIGGAQRATSDATNASEASYADVIAAGKARGEAPYTLDNRTGPDGAPVYGVVSDRFGAGPGAAGAPAGGSVLSPAARRALGPAAGQGGMRGQSPADATYGTATATSAAARYEGYVKAGQDAQGQVNNLQRIGQLLGDFEGGKLAQAGMSLASAANSLGIKLDPKLGDKQAAAALSNSIALSMHSQMPGPLSNADRDYLTQMSPGMAQSAGGRQKIIDTQTKVAQRAQDYSSFAQKWAQKYGGIHKPDTNGNTFEDSLRVYAAQHPVFGAAR